MPVPGTLRAVDVRLSLPGTQSVQPSQMSSVVWGVVSAPFVPTDGSSNTGLPNFRACLSPLLGFTLENQLEMFN